MSLVRSRGGMPSEPLGVEINTLGRLVGIKDGNQEHFVRSHF